MKYIKVLLLILASAAFIVLFLQKDRIMEHLSHTMTRAYLDDRGQASGYYESYDLVKAGKHFRGTLLEFGAENCISCRNMKKVLEEITTGFGSLISIRSINITTPEGMREGREFGVLMIPMQVLLDRHGMVVYTHTGYIQAADLSDKIKDELLSD